MKFSLTHFICAMCCLAVCGLRAATETAGAPRDIVALPSAFPTHWTQYGAYGDFAIEPYGYWAQPGCVAIAGAATMEALQWPRKFLPGQVIFDGYRDLYAGEVDWPSLAPMPNRPEGMATVHGILYNLGLLTQMRYGANGGASTTLLSYLGKALTDEHVGYASAYTVQLSQSATTQDAIEAAVWAPIRCGSPVPLSVNLGYGAHAVVAYGYGNDPAGGPSRTAIFVGYAGPGVWSTLPTFDKSGLKDLDSALSGVVAERPAGVADGAYAFPIIGTVQNSAGRPVPYATVTLKHNGADVGKAVTDHVGRYGIWGWFGGTHTVSCGDASADFGQWASPVYRGAFQEPRMETAELIRVVKAHKNTLVTDTPASFAVFADYAAALDDAKTNNRYILCLRPSSDDERLEIRQAAEAGLLEDYTLWYTHPETGKIVGDMMKSRPTAKAFVLTAMEAALGYCLPGQPLADFLRDGCANSPSAQRLDASAVLSGIGLLPGNDLTLAGGVTLTLDGTLRVGTLTTEGDVELVAQDAAPRLDIANLSLGGPLTVSGARLDLVPNASLTQPVTLTGGARLVLKNSISLPSVTLEGAELIVATGTAPLPPSLSLSGSVSVTASDKAALTLSESSRVELGADTVLTWTAPLTGKGTDALTFAASAGTPSLTLQGIQAPVIVQGPARLDGGSLGDNLGLLDGAALTSGRLLTVSGTVTATDTIPVSGTRVGTFLETATSNLTFTVAEGFGVEETQTDGRSSYRLISTGSTPPAVYVGGEMTALTALPEGNDAHNLLILTPRPYKEMGYWETFAAWKSSEAGGHWTVMVASPSNIPENTTMEAYVASQPADYVILGATSATNAVDGQDNLWLADLSSVPAGTAVGRIPLVPELTLPYRPQSGGVSTKTLTAEEQIAGYATKSARALAPWQPGRMLCIGTAFKETSGPYVSSTDYTAFDGLPPMAEWDYVSYFPKHSALAMREHYRQLCLAKPARKPFAELGFSADGIGSGNANVGTAAIQTREGAVLWTEGAGTNAAVAATLSCALDGNTRANIAYVGDMTGLHALALMPVGQSASMPLLTETAPTAGIGMALVLNPAGGALAALAVPEAYEAVVLQDGTVDYTLSAAHAACLNILKRLVADPQLTVGEAFAEEKTSALTLFGDPTVRIAPFTMPGWILKLK